MKKVNLNSFDDFEHIGQKLKIFSQVGAPLKQNFLNFSRLIGFSPSMDSSASTLQVEKEKVRSKIRAFTTPGGHVQQQKLVWR